MGCNQLSNIEREKNEIRFSKNSIKIFEHLHQVTAQLAGAGDKTDSISAEG